MFSSSTPIAEYFQLAYVPDKLPGDAHQATRVEYLLQLAKLQRYFVRWRAEIKKPPRPIELGDYCDELLKYAMRWEVEPAERGGAGNTAGTANKLYRHCRAIWEHAWGADYVSTRCRTKPYREIRRKPRAWLPAEIERIICATLKMPGHVGPVPAPDFWLPHILVGMSQGARISAQMETPTANWDPERGEILIPGEEQKQREDQTFTLFPSANEALKRLDPIGRGLPTLFADWPYDPDRRWRILRKHLRKLLVLAGLFEKVKDATRRDLFHKFRKTVATEIAIKKGIAAAQMYLGHSSEQVTRGYIDDRRMERVKLPDVLDDPGAAIKQLRLFGEAS
jgi:integrase